MGYLDNYRDVRNRYKNYLSKSQSRKLLDLSKKYSRMDAYNRVAAASALRTGFQQGFNGLRNTGMQNSGEVERLKRSMQAGFDAQNQELNKNERAMLGQNGRTMKRNTIAARQAMMPFIKTKKMIANSGQHGIGGGGGKMLKQVK